jgi:mannose-6-phosphate isomerase class I
MEITKKKQSLQFQNGNITAHEYPSQNKNISGGYVEIKGRYPTEGWICNQVCTELVFIIKGSVTLTTETESFSLKEMDQVIINPNEKYFWDGDCVVLVPSTPPWSPEQTKII